MPEHRTLERLRQHYEVERELAARLRAASADERRRLYAVLYDELYRRVPDHPQLTGKSSAESTAATVATRMKLLRRFLRPDTTFLEVGAGDCALSLEVDLSCTEPRVMNLLMVLAA